MPGIMAPAGPGTGHHPSAITKPLESDLNNNNILTEKCCRPDSDLLQVQKSSEVRLVKPLSKKVRRIMVRKTTKLIERRNRLDRKVLREVENQNPDIHDWLPREKLLRKREALRERERYHLLKRTKKLAKLEALWRRDPSSIRHNDYNLVHELLLRFKRNLGPLLEEYTTNHNGGGVDDDRMSPPDLGSGSEWIDTSESEDEELHRATVVAKSPSLSEQRSPKDSDSHSQNKKTIKDTNKEASLGPRANWGKRKCEEAPTESESSKKVRFAIDEDTDGSQPSRQKEKSKSKKNKKSKKRKENKDREKEQAFAQEVQTNDK
ncbi:hypothetical protein F4782DRAFT_213811 [Xylaria castorea]|nr:hypothetical protein F4782DRAFT_213811 [Xylaria castorea]